MASFRDKQMVAPAPSGPANGHKPMGVAEAEKYLQEADWQQTGYDQRGNSLWSDPAGAGSKVGVAKASVTLPAKDGAEPSTISQVVVPPAGWSHPVFEAVQIQRSRDGRTTAAASASSSKSK